MTPAQREAAVKAAQRRMVWAGIAGAPGFIALAFYLMGRFAEPLTPALGTPDALAMLGSIAVVSIAAELYLVVTALRQKAALQRSEH